MRIVKNRKIEDKKGDNAAYVHGGTGVEKNSTLYKVQQQWDEKREKRESQKVSIAPYILSTALFFAVFAVSFVITIIAETQNKFLGARNFCSYACLCGFIDNMFGIVKV